MQAKIQSIIVLFFALIFSGLTFAVDAPIVDEPTTWSQGKPFPKSPGVCESPSTPEVLAPNFNELSALNKGEVVCKNKNCRVVISGSLTREIIELTKDELTGEGLPYWDEELGRIRLRFTNKEVHFWHQCQDILDHMKVIVANLAQQKATKSLRTEIALTFQIYNIAETNFRETAIGLNGLLKGKVGEEGSVTPKAELSLLDNASNLIINFGNLTENLLSLDLKRAKGKNSLRRVDTYVVRSFDGIWFEPRSDQPVFTAPGLGTPEKDVVGYNFSGKPSLVEGHPNLIELSNLNIRYAEPRTGEGTDGQSLARTVLRQYNFLYAPIGRPIVVYQEASEGITRGNLSNLPSHFQKQYLSSNSRLVIYMTANIAGQEEVSNLKKVEKPEKLPVDDELVASLREQAEEFEEGTEPQLKLEKQIKKDSVERILESATFKNIRLKGGESLPNMMSFKLDSSLLTQENYNKDIRVRIKGVGYPGKGRVRKTTIGNLALNQFQFPSTLTGEPSRRKEYAQVTVTLSVIRREGSKIKELGTTKFDVFDFISDAEGDLDQGKPKSSGF